MSRWTRIGLALAAVVLVLFLIGRALGRGALGVTQDGGTVTPVARPAAPGPTDSDGGILFGDFHVHTTFSQDAFMVGLPMAGGEGAHPPADACDFARFCAALDFWSINDHAESLTPHQWRETRDAIRQCDDAAGEPPDLVSFLGWEWTQIGTTPENHYGHKNVVLRDTADDRVPARPIASREQLFPPSAGPLLMSTRVRLALIAASPRSDDRQPYHDLARFLQDRDDVPSCPAELAPDDRRADCHEAAKTPTELFARLRGMGFEHLVIPHGTTWGIYTPPGSSWDKQLVAHTDPERDEPLIEVFSGHGNTEEYRPWRAIEVDAEGNQRCPEPTGAFVPECWRAGELIRERCTEAGEDEAECERRAVEARQHHVDAGFAGHLTVPGARAEEWLDAGQCPDCYMPAYAYRPGGAVQYALALRDWSDPASPKQFRFGFLASSDIHSARPGTGFKELDRLHMSDSRLASVVPVNRDPPERVPYSVPFDTSGGQPPDFERFSSFFGSAGLVAVHAESRSREAIWDALGRRAVYGTSGDRILLWFDWVDEEGGAPQPMGSEVTTARTPRFRVRALGAREQLPGCPDDVQAALGPERFARLCRGECYHPADTRRRIDRIEVIRIRPQIRAGEPVEDLIEDPWLVLGCRDTGEGCTAEFTDTEYAKSGRDATYYVRAVQEDTPTVNGGNVRCERDEEGRCIESDPCYADERTDPTDDCLWDVGERAWSSPIFLVHGS